MTQVKIEGGRYVGGVPHQKRQWEDFKKRDGREFVEFDDPDHLVQAHSDMLASESEDKTKRAALREYISFWAGQKRQEIAWHQQAGCYQRCETCFLCLSCRNAVGQRWRCTCTNGTKMLSPYRHVWLNGSIKAHALKYIWDVNRLMYVRKSPEKYGQNARGLDDLVALGS